MKISVMITTRNRIEDLKRTVERLSSLNPSPHEILICADGCEDETVDFLKNSFPQVHLFENYVSIGSVGARKALLKEATGDWVLSLDDDSYPLDSDFIEKIESVISRHPEAAVVTFPEERDGGTFVSQNKTPESPGHYVSSYANCGAVMNRRFYLDQPGFPVFFVHMYEEPDYALQCYAAGASVWFEPSLVIRHHQSPSQRNQMRRHHQNARNELWSAWMRCPWPWVLLVTVFRKISQLRYASTEGFTWVMREPLYWLEAWCGIRKAFQFREPIPWRIYFAWMCLARRPIHTLKQLNKSFGFNWKT